MNQIDTFLDGIDNMQRQADSRQLIRIMRSVTRVEPALWGSIIGFGTHHYKYETGREGDTVAVGFAPRKSALVIYGLTLDDHNATSIKELGPVTTGKGCLYIKSLAEINADVLEDLIRTAFRARHNV